MDWFRRQIGLVTPQQDASQTNYQNMSNVEDSREKSAKLARADRIRLGALRDELQDVKTSLDIAIAENNTVDARKAIQKRNNLQDEIRKVEGRMANQSVAQRTIANADANRETALLMKTGAQELKSIVDDTERIDLDDIIDTYKEGADRTHEYSNRLAEPLWDQGAAETSPDGMDVDSELEQMMQRAADEKALFGNNQKVTTFQPKNPQVENPNGNVVRERLKNKTN